MQGLFPKYVGTFLFYTTGPGKVLAGDTPTEPRQKMAVELDPAFWMLKLNEPGQVHKSVIVTPCLPSPSFTG